MCYPLLGQPGNPLSGHTEPASKEQKAALAEHSWGCFASEMSDSNWHHCFPYNQAELCAGADRRDNRSPHTLSSASPLCVVPWGYLCWQYLVSVCLRGSVFHYLHTIFSCFKSYSTTAMPFYLWAPPFAPYRNRCGTPA